MKNKTLTVTERIGNKELKFVIMINPSDDFPCEVYEAEAIGDKFSFNFIEGFSHLTDAFSFAGKMKMDNKKNG